MSLYEFGPFQLDEARLLLLDRGTPTPIGPKVVETLLALIEHPGELFPKADLLARIWPEGYVDEANLAQNVYVLRKTLRRSWDVEAIETIPRRGYRFAAPVRRREEPPRPEPAAVRPAQPSLP
ncbi:MAG: winged helix-turn-helix domain-containing protein, partial [Candidatus Cybelea sp.]